MSDILESDSHAHLLGYESFDDQEQFVIQAAILINASVGSMNGILRAIQVIEIVLKRLHYKHEEVGVDAQEFFSVDNLQKVFMKLDKSSIIGISEDLGFEF